MTDQFIDESVQKPSLKFWLILVVVIAVVGTGLFWSYSYLFPNQVAGLSLSGLAEPQPKPQTPVPQSSEATTAQPASPSTSLVTDKDTISGYQVSHPAKWSTQSQDGFVLLRSDECGSTTVVFYPIQLLGNAPKTIDLLPTVVSAFSDGLKDGKQGLTLGSVGAEGDSGATALLSGSLCGSEITGTAQLTVQGNRALFKLAWYPVALKDQLTNTLTQVFQSYKSVVSTATFGYQGSVFQLPVPDGWLFEESDTSGSAHSGDRLFRLSKIDFSADQPLDTALDAWVQQEKDAGRELSSLKVDSSSEQSGDDASLHRYNTKTRFVTYKKDGVDFQGSLTAAFTDVLGNSALILWRSAPAKEWALAEPTLLLLEQGANYQLDPSSPVLHVPVYATWRDASPLTGTSIRTNLNSASSKLWQPLILHSIQLTDSSGAHYIAPLNAMNPETGTYAATKDGKSVSLTPTKTSQTK